VAARGSRRAFNVTHDSQTNSLRYKEGHYQSTDYLHLPAPALKMPWISVCESARFEDLDFVNQAIELPGAVIVRSTPMLNGTLSRFMLPVLALFSGQGSVGVDLIVAPS